MKIIYFVVSFIFGIATWLCTQLDWQYAYILEYICLFIASWFLALVFVYQEENESSKKYNLLTPCNLLYVVVIAVLLFLLRKYKIEDYKVAKYSFYKLVVVLNACQGVALMAFYKFRDFYIHI